LLIEGSDAKADVTDLQDTALNAVAKALHAEDYPTPDCKIVH
jgi:hypothetical protein